MSTAATGTGIPSPVSTRRYKRPQAKSYLLKESYRRIGLPEIYALGEEAACEYLMKARWGDLGEDRQACPSCGAVDQHYRFEGQWVWKCRETYCGTHFTLFSGTPLHGMKMSATVLLSILFQFVENKDIRITDRPRTWWSYLTSFTRFDPAVSKTDENAGSSHIFVGGSVLVGDGSRPVWEAVAHEHTF